MSIKSLNDLLSVMPDELASLRRDRARRKWIDANVLQIERRQVGESDDWWTVWTTEGCSNGATFGEAVDAAMTRDAAMREETDGALLNDQYVKEYREKDPYADYPSHRPMPHPGAESQRNGEDDR